MAALSVIVPAPVFVRLPPVPLSTPPNAVVVLSPPTVRFFAPSTTDEPLTPAKEPTVSLPAVIPDISKMAVPPVMFTALVSANDPARERFNWPAVIVVAPV